MMADQEVSPQLALDSTGQRIIAAVQALSAGLEAAEITVPIEIPDDSIAQVVDEEW